MASSFSQELEELLNPLPKFADPEDDDDEATKARVVDPFDEDGGGDGDGDVAARLSALRKGSASLLSETDRRYVGKPVSRKQLLIEMEAEDEEEEEEDEEGSVGQQEDDDDDSMIEEEEEDDDVMDRDAKDAELLSQNDSADVTFPQGVDFHKLTDGMDDLGVSDDDDDEDDGEEEVEGSDDGDDSDGSELDGGEDGGTVQTFSREKVDEEVEKGKAVKNQLTLWDQLLEGRIKLQKALVTANQLPQPQTFGEFKRRGGAELAAELKNSHKALKALQRTLVELHDQLLYQNPETRLVTLGQGEEEEEEIMSSGDEGGGGGAPKRKLEMAEYPDFMAKRFAAFQPYRDATLQKWHDKTRLTTGRRSKGFGAFDRNILSQVEQVMLDRERLLRRTQTRRSEYRVLGKAEAPAAAIQQEEEEEQQQQQLKANAHLKDLDEDIFDDDDFYHQLLRELIERRTSASDPNDQVAMGRQWLAIQKLRSKIKKKVDTKASKGRKTRFHVHGKLLNFMAPVDHCAMSDEARSELYRGLFGQAHAVANAGARE
ncbi:protein AATF [Nelusetta ayraudi]|uniref:protein AATF n=1 Tax=Nelusetta ayraudi TaxID=303726 RepID=UPI003F730E25